jgi:hypothetical protein
MKMLETIQNRVLANQLFPIQKSIARNDDMSYSLDDVYTQLI